MPKRDYSNLVPVVGVTHLECPMCERTSKVVLTYGEVQSIRAAGGGSAVAEGVFCDHHFSVKYHVWNPRQEA